MGWDIEGILCELEKTAYRARENTFSRAGRAGQWVSSLSSLKEEAVMAWLSAGRGLGYWKVLQVVTGLGEKLISKTM